MPYKYSYLLVPVFLCLFSCSKTKRYAPDAATVKRYPLLFNSSASLISDQGVSADFQLRAKQKGDTLLFAGSIANESGDTLKINPGDLQIETAKGIRTDVSWGDAKKLIVPPNSIDTVKFCFAPLNNLNLHERINYNGDMDSVYYIGFNFVHQKKPESLFGQRLHFSLNKSSYAYYKDHFAIEKSISIFQLKNKDSVKSSLTQAIFNSGHVKNPGSDVQVDLHDIIIKGTVIRLNFYSVDSVLFLQAKIINHSQNSLTINPFGLRLSTANKILSPQMVTVYSAVYSKGHISYNVAGGDRLEFKIKYGPLNSQGFSLLSSGITYQNDHQQALPVPIAYTNDVADQP